MPPAHARPGLSRLPLGRAIIALGLLLVAINIASAIWDVRKAHERVERRAQRDFSNTTSLLAAQTASSLDAVDLVLRDAARNASAADAALAAPRLRAEMAHLPQVAALLVFDARERVVTRTDADAFDPATHALAREKGDRGRFLSDPYPQGGRWRFLLSRHLPDGGTLAAAIELESFDALYRMIDLGAGSFITLRTFDGAIVARVPDPQGVRGQRFQGRPDMDEAVRRDGTWQGWAQSPILGEPVLLSASLVRGFPVFVMSGATEHAVFEPWRDEAWAVLDRTVLTSGAMLVLIALAAWGLARRERALARNWTRYQAMIEHSSDALVLTRPGHGGIVYASPAVERVLGYPPGEMRGREVIDFIHPDHVEGALRLRDELLRSPGKVAFDEVKLRHKDGGYRWIEVTRSNLIGEPSVKAVVINLRDITERKQAEAERARLEQRLRQAEKLEAVGRLAGGIAHDFNNILGGILGYAEMLSDKAPAGSPLKRYADNVLTGANRASGLVDQILSYSRSQRGRRGAVDFGAVVAETLELVRGSLASGIALEARLPAEPLHVVGDPTQLHQVTMNLCTNAIQAMREGGVLRVTLEHATADAERMLSHSTLRPGSYVRLTIEDTGDGMDGATLGRIFEPFFTTKEVGKGTGLGLALVYGIVTDSAGAIDVASTKPGGNGAAGSRFSIYLPQVESPLPAADAAASAVARGNGERVLIVDDEEALVAVTSEALKRMGYEPVGCADGAAALATFDAGAEVDAVIADEVMPGLSGTQLARALRSRRPGLPIVLVSGYTGPILAEQALGAGVTEILKKPVQSRDMAAALARVLLKRP